MANVTKFNRFINPKLACALMQRGLGHMLQIGQWVRWDNNKCSRIVRKNGEGSPVQLHPGHGIGTVEQRFRRAHAMAQNGWLSINEPQATALAVSKSNDIVKMRANVSIMEARIAELQAGV